MKNSQSLPLGSKGGGLTFTAAVALYFAISLLVSAVISIAGIGGTDAAKYLSLLVSPVAVGLTAVFSFAFLKQPARRLLPLKCHPKYFLIGLLLVFGLLFSLNSVNDWLIKLFELMGYERKPSFLPDYSGWKVLPVLIVVAVIPAVAEEVLFRGLILNNAEEGVGTWRAVLIVGFCFSIYHASVEQTVYQFICGCLFAFLAVRAHSVVPTVFIHFINNALIIILYAAGAVDEATGRMLISNGGQIALYVLSAVALAGAVVWLILDKGEVKEKSEGGVKTFFVYAAAGIAALVLLWIAGLFI